jgi:hypothetical protein
MEDEWRGGWCEAVVYGVDGQEEGSYEGVESEMGCQRVERAVGWMEGSRRVAIRSGWKGSNPAEPRRGSNRYQ